LLGGHVNLLPECSVGGPPLALEAELPGDECDDGNDGYSSENASRDGASIGFV